ncbi:MAG: glycogen debranching N-terminal domain-containing protein, partial [Caulobacteraceae bacterium]
MTRTDVNVFTLRPGEYSAHRAHTILVTDSRGQIRSGVEGVYFRCTRFLSRLTMKVAGEEPDFASANPVLPHFLISYHLAPSPAGAEAGPTPKDQNSGGEIAKKAIEIQMNRFAGGGLHADVHLSNHGMAEAEVELSFELTADFADLSEAQS